MGRTLDNDRPRARPRLSHCASEKDRPLPEIEEGKTPITLTTGNLESMMASSIPRNGREDATQSNFRRNCPAKRKRVCKGLDFSATGGQSCQKPIPPHRRKQL